MNPDRNKYKDLLVIVVGFCAIGLLMIKGYGNQAGWYFIYSALGLGALCVFSETLTHYVTLGWQKFGMFLGMINTTILLGVLFAFMLTPIALLKRLTTGRSAAGDSGSTWQDADTSTMDFEKMW